MLATLTTIPGVSPVRGSNASGGAHMSKDRCVFARAERLALFGRDTLKLEGVALNDMLHTWRDKYCVSLSSWALSIIVSHVAPGHGAQHVGVSASEPIPALPPDRPHTQPIGATQ